jgi:hypothetical protein
LEGNHIIYFENGKIKGLSPIGCDNIQGGFMAANVAGILSSGKVRSDA